MIGLSRILRGVPDGMLMESELQTIAGEPEHDGGHEPTAVDYASRSERIVMVEFMLFDEQRKVFTPLRAFFDTAAERVRDDDLLHTARSRLAGALEAAAEQLRRA